jgi:glycogen debranching enzyme
MRHSLQLCCSSAAVLISVLLISTVGKGAPFERHGDEGMSAARSKRASAGPEERSVQERWEIRVPAGASREYIYTNHVATHFSGEAVVPNSRSYHGLFCAMYKYLDSWEVTLGGEKLDPGAITEALAYPHVLYRAYAKPEVMEEILLPDFENGFAVSYGGAVEGHGELVPWVDMRFIWDTPKPEYKVFWMEEDNVLLISRVDNPFSEGRPRWLAVTSNVPMRFTSDERSRETDYPKDAARHAMGRAYPFSPGRLDFTVEKGARAGVMFAFGLGLTEDEASGQAATILMNFDALKRAKLRRIEGLISEADLETADADFNKALRWARVSMDNLMMDQRGKGIYAGFFWFPNYWGRDSFISLPGACLATGRFEEARDILTSFMQYQMTDAASPLLGRFPNIVNPDNLQYAGVDGTWWLVRAAWKYFLATGDRDFLVAGFPGIRLAIEGALKKAVDNQGFLTHGDGETWMDAGGEAHPYSPRGNRAVEVEALFHHGLVVGAAWARTLAALAEEQLNAGAPEPEKSVSRQSPAELLALASKWETQASILATNFRRLFWSDTQGYLYDHLNKDGTPDKQIRANAILALWVSLDRRDFLPLQGSKESLGPGALEPLIDEKMARAIVETASQTIILPFGVASLSPRDPQFHPYHLNWDRYFFDEAYHNGDVWEWLTGPAVSCFLSVEERDAAWKLMEPLVDEILNRGCVGSLREIRDGVFTEGKEEFGGATSQAWSLAEFIRVCLTDFLRFHDVGEPPSGASARREKRAGASSSRGGEAKGAPGCAVFRYMGIESWMSARPKPGAQRIPPTWGKASYRIICPKSCSVDILSAGAGTDALEGSIEVGAPVMKGQRRR